MKKIIEQVRIILAGCSAAAAMGAGTPALAQGDGTAAAGRGAAVTELQDIVVTAQKQEERLQSVPIAISAIGGSDIDALHATTLQGLQGSVPNVQINNFTNTPNNAVIFIRGVGVIEVDPFAGNTVSVVQDGVPQYFSYGALLDLFDVDRIEVLRGPQGTLFGANSTGGVINVVTRAPTGEFGGHAEASYGNYNRLDLKAALDVPLVDKVLAGKISAISSGRDGYFHNIVDGQRVGKRDMKALRGALRFTPTDSFEGTFLAEYTRSRNDSPTQANGGLVGDLGYLAPGTLVPGALLPMYVQPCQSINDRCHAPDEYLTASNGVPSIGNMDNYRGALTLNWIGTALGDVTSITGYKHFQLREFTDQDTTPLTLVNTNRRTRGWQFSEELRTTFDVGSSLKFLFGGFYMKTHYDHFMNVTLDVVVPGLRQYNTQDQDNWSASFFGQGYFQVTDRLRLLAGMRYMHEKTSMLATVDTLLNLQGPALLVQRGDLGPGEISLGGIAPSASKSWDNVSWKVGADYQATDDLLAYVSYARGVKSGGFVGRLILPSDIGPYNPEKVDTVEVGLKGDFLDKRLRANAAVFYTNYRDMQVAQTYFIQNPDGTSSNGTTIFNAAKSELKGFELEITALPVDGLVLSGSVAYLDAKYKHFDYADPLGGTLSLKGYKLQNAPKWTTSASASYSFPVATGTMMASARYNYSSSKYNSSVTLAPRALIQPTHYVNANLDWSPGDERWTIGLWVNNLFDKRYIQSVVDAPGFYDNIGYGSPREYGVDFKFKW
ncbi:MAG: TonB-dependent receptor [Dehalococcoidia bacterium]